MTLRDRAATLVCRVTEVVRIVGARLLDFAVVLRILRCEVFLAGLHEDRSPLSLSKLAFFRSASAGAKLTGSFGWVVEISLLVPYVVESC